MILNASLPVLSLYGPLCITRCTCPFHPLIPWHSEFTPKKSGKPAEKRDSLAGVGRVHPMWAGLPR